MNFIVRRSERKWTFGGENRTLAAMVTAVVALCLLWGELQPALAHKPVRSIWGRLFVGPPRLRDTLHAAKVPLPKPRPAEAPQLEEARGEPEIPPPRQAMQGPLVNSADQTEAAQPQPSPCREALTEDIAIAPSIPGIHGPGACGGDDLVRLQAIVLPDKRRVTVSPAAMLRCPMARAVADWVRADIAPLLQKLGSEISDLDQLDSFECRGRNGVKGAPLSEHGRANALDVHAFRLANGRSIGLTDRNVGRELREDVLHAACTRFTTVLGPDSDWYHEDHIHLDLLERRNNYKICQWDVLDPLPKVAPLLPAQRPAEASPHKVAGKNGKRANSE